jgi:hypothetical protein
MTRSIDMTADVVRLLRFSILILRQFLSRRIALGLRVEETPAYLHPRCCRTEHYGEFR